MIKMDLNVDLGEGGPCDAALMALASSVNIACGGHAGNEETIHRTVQLALAAHVAIGAHPGYEDPAHFGRRAMALAPEEIRSLIHRQLERFLAIHPALHHVKPHGALYHQADQDEATATALISAIAEIQPRTILYCPPHGWLAKVAEKFHLTTCHEAFIDRRYQNDGSLCPRSDPRALIQSPTEALSQALQISLEKKVLTIQKTLIPLPAQTLCIHGETDAAVTLLRLTRNALETAAIRISAP